MRRSVVAGCSTSVGSLYAENSRKLGCHCAKYLGSLSLSCRDVRSHVATSKNHPSATSRRGSPHRDVDHHVATWITTSRRGSPRRDVDHHVATLVFEASVTSRRVFSRRDVILIFLCHVAT